MALIVHKYGGTSMGSTERIRNVAKRVAKWARAGHQMVVVPSAMSGETNRLLALAKELFKYAAIAAIGAYLLFKVIMPLIRTMMTPPPKPAGVTLGGNVNIVSDDENDKPTAAVALEQKLGHARDLAQQDPKVVANIIKDWTSSNAS